MTLGQLERPGIAFGALTHPTYTIPPNAAAWFAAAQLGTAIAVGTPSAPFVYTLVQRGHGTAAAPCIIVASGTTFTAADAVTFVCFGKDENYVPIQEQLVCVGNGAATQQFFFSNLFSAIDALHVINYSGTPSTETFSLGSGDLTNVRGQHLHPRLAASQVTLYPTGVATPVQPSSVLQGGRILVIPSTNVNPRISAVAFIGVDIRTLSNL